MLSYLKVFVLLGAMVALFGAIGSAVGGQSGMLIALAVAALMAIGMYLKSGQLALRAFKAQLVGPQQAPELFEIVDRLRQRAGLPMPSLAIAPHAQPNAFATGRSPEHAVVCVTEGLVQLVNRAEIEGVIAHELAHIKTRDMLLQTVTATLSGAITNLAQFGLFVPSARRRGSPFGPLAILLAPVGAMLLQATISRTREFEADRIGAEISGQPLALASALLKLQTAAQRIPMRVPVPMGALAQVNPFASARAGRLMAWFQTHPPTEERVARLQAIARASQGAGPDVGPGAG
jgi:heat shock protein HtpX